MKIVFFGSSKHVIPVINVLKENFELSLVVTTEQNPSDAVPSFCINNNLNYSSVSSLSDSNIDAELLKLNCEIAVLGYFGLMIPKGVLNLFPKGIINIHPSLLPKYRGPTPIQSAILNGEKTTGITIIRLDDKIDHGPILSQREEKILEDDTADTLYERLFKIGSDLIHQNIKQYVKEELKLQEQDDSKATFTKLLQKNDGLLDFDNPPSSVKIGRMIRAYYPWPGVWFKWRMENARPAQPGRSRGKWKIIKLLPGDKIQVEGKNPMSYKDFINGYKEGKEILNKLNLS